MLGVVDDRDERAEEDLRVKKEDLADSLEDQRKLFTLVSLQ